jgi:hypothetical protein
MTHSAAREKRRVVDVVFFHESFAQRQLVGRLSIFHTEDLLARTKFPLGMSMAVKAPLHQQGMRLECERHLVDLAMASRTADAFLHMDAVIEVHESR